jgi:predicted ester cyclase
VVREEEIRAAARRLVAQVLGVDDGDLAELVEEDVVDHAGAPGAPAGRAGLAAGAAAFRAAFPDLELRVVDTVVENDRAATQWEGRGTHGGAFMGVPPTGKAVTMSGVDIVRFGASGKVVERWAQAGLLGTLQQLGVVPGYEEPPPVPPQPAGDARATSVDENKDVMRRHVEEIWNKGNLEVADEVFHPAAITPTAPQLPPGPDGCKVAARIFREAFPDFRMTIEDVLGEDDKVVARYRQHGTHEGELFGIPPTGRQVDFEEIALLRFADGRIVSSWFQTDLLTMMTQLGVVPAPSQAETTVS